MNRPMMMIGGAILVAALQIGFLAWSIAARAAILRDGSEIVLKVNPVDPRDLLRGDYVRLGYEISSITSADFPENTPNEELTDGRTVFVRLERQGDGFWRVVSASLDEKPSATPGPGLIDLRGALDGDGAPSGLVRVVYGIERFYLPEGEGKEIERDMRERAFTMKVAVSDGGAAQIKAFFDGETQLYAEPLY